MAQAKALTEKIRAENERWNKKKRTKPNLNEKSGKGAHDAIDAWDRNSRCTYSQAMLKQIVTVRKISGDEGLVNFSRFVIDMCFPVADVTVWDSLAHYVTRRADEAKLYREKPDSIWLWSPTPRCDQQMVGNWLS